MTYVFGDLDPQDVEPILQTAELYLTKPDGVLPWAERPLKKGVIARIPPVQ
jgi:predicted metal-binding protein